MIRTLYAALLAALLLSGCASAPAHHAPGHVCGDDCYGYYDMTPEEYAQARLSFERGM